MVETSLIDTGRDRLKTVQVQLPPEGRELAQFEISVVGIIDSNKFVSNR
jgi:hypothetical protein